MIKTLKESKKIDLEMLEAHREIIVIGSEIIETAAISKVGLDK